MSQEFLAHLFEPFTRSPGAARIEGTGLGLSVTKGLLDQMGGHISVESRENQGSVFCAVSYTHLFDCERLEGMPGSVWRGLCGYDGTLHGK